MNMGRSNIVAALIATSLTLVLVFHLIASFGLPQLDFLHLRYDTGRWRNTAPQRSLGPETSDQGNLYLLGVGKADITGYGNVYSAHEPKLTHLTARPVVEINMMGYADPDQVGSGLRQRLYSRAFIIGDAQRPEERFVYLVLDTQSGDTAIRHGILQGLSALGTEYAVYGQENVAVTGTHSHSGPGAWLNYLLPQITSKGFDKQSYRAIVDGALLSIRRAHESLSPGYLIFGSTDIKNANINRSLYAYLSNPREERDEYEHDVDKTMTMLSFQRAEDGKSTGILTWFPVHGTSMLGNNTLISGDNKGVAAYLFEESVKHDGSAADGFVAGFSQANVGDTSPNVLGAYCEDGSGEECNFEDSTCGGKSQPCHGRGPFFRVKDEGASSCFEIGRRQFEGASALYKSLNEGGTRLRGSTVKSLHTFQDFSNFTFSHPNGTLVSTCRAALGYSFAAGTTDGPGAFDFKQNDTDTPDANPLWSVVRGFLHEPSKAQEICQRPKPILLDVGEIHKPYLWSPNIVDIQLLRVGQLIIIVSPGEATTMSGRRWKAALKAEADAIGLTDGHEPLVVLGGPANSYTHYIATEEEYRIQRYEGASTLYGPHTLNAYINLTRTYLPYLHAHETRKIGPGPSPPIHTNTSLSFITGVLYDRPPLSKSFGDVLVDVKPSYTRHDGTPVVVTATFVGANPRNNLRLEGTYAAVERLGGDGTWMVVRTDWDWGLIFRWKRTSSVLATSEVSVEWEVEDWVEDGIYRLRYFGDRKAPVTGKIEGFEGVSGEFILQ